MYKYIRNMLVVATLISTASAVAVLADDSTASPTPKPSVSTQDLRVKAQEVKDNIQAKKDEIQKKKDDLAKQLTDKKAEQENKRQENRTKVVNFWSQLGRQLQVLIDNETKLADRVGSKLDQMAAQGKDVTAAQTKLANARKLIKDAQDTYDANTAKAKTVLQSVPVSTTASNSVDNKDLKTALKQVSDLVKQVMDKIKLAHQALTDVTSSLKPSASPRPSESPKPSHSPSPTPTTQS